MTLDDMLDRLFHAEEGSAELDCLIASQFHIAPPDAPGWLVKNFSRYAPSKLPGHVAAMNLDGQEGVNWKPLAFTRSIDAAVTLVPAGFQWECTFSRHVPHSANVCSSREAHGGWDGHSDHSRPIAICIAALKARAAQEGSPT